VAIFAYVYIHCLLEHNMYNVLCTNNKRIIDYIMLQILKFNNRNKIVRVTGLACYKRLTLKRTRDENW